MLEKWNNGEMGFDQIVTNHLTIQRLQYVTKSDRIPLEITIPLFHHSMYDEKKPNLSQLFYL
jgi:hypothetical protein